MSPLRSFAHTTYSALSSFFVHGTSILCCPPHTRPSILLDKPFCKQIRFTSSQLTASPPNKALIWNKESLFRSERAAFATQLSPLFPAAFASFSRKRESERAKSAFYCLTNRQTLLLGVRSIPETTPRRLSARGTAAEGTGCHPRIGAGNCERISLSLSLPASWSNFFSLAHSPVCQKATTRTAARYISVVCPICPLLIPHIPLRGENADVIEFVHGAQEVGRVGFLCHSLMVTLPHFPPVLSFAFSPAAHFTFNPSCSDPPFAMFNLFSAKHLLFSSDFPRLLPSPHD